MKEYKVINSFGIAKKGDVLSMDEDGLFSFNIADERSVRSMAMDEEYANKLVEDGKLTVLENEEEDFCENCNKILKIDQFCDDMIEQYNNDYDDMMNKYNEGEVPPCVKVEAETVYFNLVKLLKEIKNIINE